MTVFEVFSALGIKSHVLTRQAADLVRLCVEAQFNGLAEVHPYPYLSLIPWQTFQKIIRSGQKQEKDDDSIRWYLLQVYQRKAAERMDGLQRRQVKKAPVRRVMRKRKRRKANG